MKIQEKTPPKIVNGFVKSNLIQPRFEKDQFATLETFKSRAKLFSVLDVKSVGSLTNPKLVSSLHGEIQRLLFTIPYWVFFPESYPNETKLIKKYADVFRGIISTLPENTNPLVFTHKIAKDKLDLWLNEFGISHKTEVILAEDSLNFTVWAEDAYCISQDLDDNETYFVEPASFNRADDAYIADRIAPASNLERTQAQLYFQGGNVLIGDDFWFIGADYPANSLKLGFIVPESGETELEAIRRGYGNYLDKSRKLIVVGSRVPVPSSIKRPTMIDGELWQEILYFGNHKGTVQPLFHIDMFISLVGRNDSNGKYQLMVADPKMAAEILEEEIIEGSMIDVFNDIADGLEEQGFEIIRNPMPLVYDDDDSEKTRYWYFATGNNVLLQDKPKTVWIPTYGHGNWKKLEKTDSKNVEIWESLGFTVNQLPNFHPFAANLGAAHCITKYLGRNENEQPIV